MNSTNHIIKTLKIIFAVLFVYVSLGDWHIHAASSHHCDEEHTSVHSDFKWQPHEACENSEDSDSHEDYKQALTSSKILVQFEAPISIITPIPFMIHQQHSQDCLVQVDLNQRLLASTFLLI